MVDGTKYKKVKELLMKIFQFEDSDLDFGIYRIMNLKRKEIKNFIDKELKNEVKKEFSKLISSKEVNLGDEKEKIKEQIKTTFGNDIPSVITNPQFKETPLVKRYLEIEAQLKQENEIDNKEDEIYDSILSFFSRYYDEGDFISKRRYSNNEKYAIPYNGEEVYLHWANSDQYYVKTSEDFNFYSFNAGSLKIDFKISADDVEVGKNNNKTTGNRYFIIDGEETKHNENLLEIYFGYRVLSNDEENNILEFINKDLTEKQAKKKITQELINQYNVNKVHNFTMLRGLKQIDAKEEKSSSGKSVLEYNLSKYTKKNTSDYFIHKNLGQFLKRELDFYIKNEMFRIDDVLNNESGLKLDLNKISVFKSISLKVIDFLDQIENFQKKLFEKKKFVIENEYCLTIDNLDQKYFKQILENKEQLEEWIQLGFVDKVEEIDLKFLKGNPTLVLDTKFFSEDFKYEILETIDNLEEKTNGLLINSENFQALNLLQEKYKEKIDCCYIDPPYNTGDDGFIYKDGYSNSSWLSMISNTIQLSKKKLNDIGSIAVSIDENEMINLFKLLETNYGSENFIENIIWNKRVPKNDKGVGNIHEYIAVYAKNKYNRGQNDLSYVSRKDGLDDIYELVNKLKQKKINIEKSTLELKKLYKKNGYDRGITLYCNLSLDYRIWGKINLCWPNAKTDGPRYKILHPTTRKPVRIPKKGWRWKEETFKNKCYGKPEMLFDGSIKWGDIWFGKDETTQPSGISYLDELENFLLRSILSLKSQGSLELEMLFGKGDFPYPKPIALLLKIIYACSNKNSIILDYFAGTGTTAHSTLKLNKEDAGNRKYLMIEMGEYFNNLLKPRIQKVIYSQNWKDGKPLDNDGTEKHIFKYQTLEQYEDTLNNIDFKEQPTLIQETKDYNIKYMMEFESKHNNVFLNLEELEDPFTYTLDIFNSNNEKIQKKVDLIETFNYIAGIDVDKINVKNNKDKKYIVVKGKRGDNKIIVIWRNKKDNFDPQEDKNFIEKEIIDKPYDEIYTNGSSSVKDAKVLDEMFKSMLFN